MTGKRKATGKSKQSEAPGAEKTAPTAAEKDAILSAEKRVQARRPRVKVNLETSASGRREIEPSHSDIGGWLAQIQNALGANGVDFPDTALKQLMAAATNDDGHVDVAKLNAMIAMIDGVQPANELEAMLACQMAVTHDLAMELVQRTQTASAVTQFDCAGNMAIKFLRTFTAQTEALAKLQRKHSQTVRVEHVHVHSGGQAIVGSVSSESNRGRGSTENVDQPHAPSELTAPMAAPMPQVWSEDEKRKAMPLPGGQR